MPFQQLESTPIAIGESAYDELIKVLGKTLDLRDNNTAGHSSRVRRYSLEIAKTLGCSPRDQKQLGRAASLHDVGKIAIPDAILRKSRGLSVAEQRVMKTHVWIGFSLLRRIEGLQEVADIVLSHHERYDGYGYPRGLRGADIPLVARIFAVADTLDAMTSDRHYRQALPYSAARDEIISQSGRQFDPKVVEAFLSIPEAIFQQIIRDEKRSTSRVPFDAPVSWIEGCRRHSLKGINISVGGLLLHEDKGMPLGQAIEIEFELPPSTRRLKIKAEAIRKELPDKTALAFTVVRPRDQALLQQYIGHLVDSSPQAVP